MNVSAHFSFFDRCNASDFKMGEICPMGNEEVEAEFVWRNIDGRGGHTLCLVPAPGAREKVPIDDDGRRSGFFCFLVPDPQLGRSRLPRT